MRISILKKVKGALLLIVFWKHLQVLVDGKYMQIHEYRYKCW